MLRSRVSPFAAIERGHARTKHRDTRETVRDPGRSVRVSPFACPQVGQYAKIADLKITYHPTEGHHTYRGDRQLAVYRGHTGPG